MNGLRQYLDVKGLVRGLALMIVVLVACKLSRGAAFVVMLPILIGCALTKRNLGALYVILFSVLIVVVSSYLAPKSFLLMVSQKLILTSGSVALGMQIFGRRHPRELVPLLCLLPYVVYMVVVSQCGWSPVISNLKLLLFSLTFFSLYAISASVANSRLSSRQVRSVFLCFAIFVLIGSIAVKPFPAISLMRSEDLLNSPNVASLYCGVLNHSQMLGIVATAFGVLVFADWLFCVRRKSVLYVVLIVSAFYLTYLSSSRTAMASFVIGVGFAAWCALKPRLMGSRWRKKVVSGLVCLGFASAVAFLVIPQAREKAIGFILKYNVEDSEMTSTDIWKSRERKLNGALANWRRSPIIGNGFQVSEEMAGVQVQDIRQMLSAPVEKSTWTYAILEEGGVLGMILFLFFIVSAMLQFIRRKAYVTATMLLTFLMINMGEFTIFSMSGAGGVIWSLVFMATILDNKNLREAAATSFPCAPLDWAGGLKNPMWKA